MVNPMNKDTKHIKDQIWVQKTTLNILNRKEKSKINQLDARNKEDQHKQSRESYKTRLKVVSYKTKRQHNFVGYQKQTQTETALQQVIIRAVIDTFFHVDISEVIYATC